jgi:HSP20 family protein
MTGKEKEHGAAAAEPSHAPIAASGDGGSGDSGSGDSRSGDAGSADASAIAGPGSGQGGAAASGGEISTTRSTDLSDGSAASRAGVLIPPVDVIEDASGITLLADMPGVPRDKLDLRLESNSLTIKGTISLDVPEGMDSRYAELKHQQYQRSFALSKELDGEQASAELTHGVLNIRIPKTAHAQPRRVRIAVA